MGLTRPSGDCGEQVLQPAPCRAGVGSSPAWEGWHPLAPRARTITVLTSWSGQLRHVAQTPLAA